MVTFTPGFLYYRHVVGSRASLDLRYRERDLPYRESEQRIIAATRSLLTAEYAINYPLTL
jgi:hypothetical protein